ncbi:MULTISPECIES: IclR family transcriptional regulator [unclassified Pseudomonas]|uniref:IclR family transcriptional regulator n=1 Tax=unclassified Pseudomonas TaxID=196821 RepID=UPI0025DC3C0B|nr:MULTISPECIES: IclR family transcriptional regulator [unclassified Pseudomonas]
MVSDNIQSGAAFAPGARQQKVQAAEVGTGILKGLAELAPSTSLSRLAEHVGMPAAKVHRYLQALIASGFAEQDRANNHYGLGREALLVGLAALGGLDVIKVGIPYLQSLRESLNETCFLAVWGNKGPTVVHVEPSLGAVTLVTRVGSVLPLLTSSTGMVFNSFLPLAETSELSDQERAHGGAPTPEDVQAQVARIRATGWNQIHGLLMPGVNAVSTPLFATGQVLAGVITVVGAASVFTPSNQASAADMLLQTADTITRRMGGTRPTAL